VAGFFLDLASHYTTAQLGEKYGEVFTGTGYPVLAPAPSGIEVVPGVGPFGLGVLRGTGAGYAETRRLGPWYQWGTHELVKVPGWGTTLGQFVYRNGSGTFVSQEPSVAVSGDGAVVITGGAGEVCRSADGIVPVGSFFTLEFQVEVDGFYIPVGAGSAAARLNGVEVCAYAGPMGGVGQITAYARTPATDVELTAFLLYGLGDPGWPSTFPTASGALAFVALASTGPDPDHADAVRFPPATPEGFHDVRYVQAVMEAHKVSGTFADLSLYGYHSDVPEWAPEEEERRFTDAQTHAVDGLSGDPKFYWGGSPNDASVYQEPWTDPEFNLTGWGPRSEPDGGLGAATGIWLEVICVQGRGQRWSVGWVPAG
jgi:hypothetical protein